MRSKFSGNYSNNFQVRIAQYLFAGCNQAGFRHFFEHFKKNFGNHKRIGTGFIADGICVEQLFDIGAQ